MCIAFDCGTTISKKYQKTYAVSIDNFSVHFEFWYYIFQNEYDTSNFRK